MKSRRAVPAAVMAGAVIALCWAWRPLLIDGLIPLDGNMIALSYPNWSMLRSLAADRLLPAWNPWRNMGEPFLANPPTMALYPPMRLLAPLSDFAGFLRAWVVLHTLLAAAFSAALAWRRWKSAPAAAAAAVVAGLNGFFMGRAIFPCHFAAAAWLPAVVFFQSELSPLGVGACLALQWLAGFPPFTILTGVAAGALAWAQGRRGVECFVKGGLWSLGLAAAQWIPFLELMTRVGRSVILDPAKAVQYSLPPAQLLTEAFVPQWSRWLPAVSGDPSIVGFYVGPACWALAAWGARRGGRTERLIAAGCAGALLLSLGAWIPGYAAFPPFRMFRFPANWLLLASGAAAVLAASGVARLSGEKLRWAAVAVLAADLIAFAAVPRAAWSRPEFLTETPPLAAGAGRIYHTDALRLAWERGTLESEEDYLLMRDFMAPSFGAAFGAREAVSYQPLRLSAADEYLRRMSPEAADRAGIDRVVSLEPGATRVTRDAVTVTRRRTARERVFREGKGTVRLVESRPAYASARVDAAVEGEVVLSEADYPGWRVFVDGRPERKRLFAGLFPAALVPAGAHEVAFSFASASVRFGLAVSVLTAAAFLLVLVQPRRA